MRRTTSRRCCALLPGFEVCFGAAVDELADDGSGRQRFGNVMVATRLPVLQVQHHALPWPPTTACPACLGWPVSATLRAPWGTPLRVTTTHLEYYSQPARLAQAQALLRCTPRPRRRRAPPLAEHPVGPFRAKPHTADASSPATSTFDPTATNTAR
jgi:endonuclease/exonuclease/phosphatase family metal-dependent hydrolase